MKHPIFLPALRANKRIFSVIIIVVMLLALLLCVLLIKNKGFFLKRGKIYTDIPVSQDPNNQCMVVPAIAILQELGYSTTQESDDVILLEKEKQQFLLNLEELSLRESGSKSGFNYLTPPPGEYYCWCSREENDITIDVVTFNSALALMGCKYRISEAPQCEMVLLYRK